MSWLSLAGGSKDQGWFQSVVRKFGFHGTIVSILSFVLYAGYLKFVKKDEKALHKLLLQELSSFVPKFPGIGHLFGPLKKLVGKQAKSSLPKATESALASIAGTGEGILSKLNPRNWKMFNHRKIAEEEDDAKFQAGEPYGDPHVLAPTLADDLKAIGIKTGLKDLHTLLETAKSVGKPMDDRELIVCLPHDASLLMSHIG